MRSTRATAGLWFVAVLLVAIGVGAAIGRSVFLTDFAARAEPSRQRVFQVLHRNPFASDRAADLALVDGRFAAHPMMTLLHTIPGGIFLLLASLQFSQRLRSRFLLFHRWSGRFLMGNAIVVALTGLYFGLLMPFGGTGESAAISIFGGLFLFSMVRAIVAVRNRQVALHREWMIRAFALGLAISTVRIVAVVLDLSLTPAGFGTRPLFVASIWTGWLLTLGGAEVWIRRTRALAS